jgi:hypothetical protein
MGIMDFLKKKEEIPFDQSSSFNSNDMNSNMITPDTTGIPSSNIDTSSYHTDQSLNSSSSMSGMNSGNFNQSFSPSQSQASPPQDIGRDLQVISLKLDAIKAELDAMNQRMKNLEGIAEREQTHAQQKKWY